MLLKDIFNEQLEIANTVLVLAQEKKAFSKSCNIFFASVKPIYNIPQNLEVYVGLEDVTDSLGLGIGEFIIGSVAQLYDTTTIKVSPLDYADFDLHRTYIANFEFTCETVLRQIDKDNLEMLKGSGIGDITVQEPVTYQELSEKLSSSYKIETGVTIF